MLINCDAKALEWRTIVELAKDRLAIEELLTTDVHEKNQHDFGLPTRLVSKRFLFRVIYRGSGYAYTVDNDFNHVSTKQSYWDDMIEKFYHKYKAIDRLHGEWAQLVAAGKPIIGPSGRQWLIDMGKDYQGNSKLPWTVFTNYPNQGTGADVMTLARISFWNRLQKKEYFEHVKLISTVHDSIVADAPSELSQELCNLFHEVFRDLPNNIKKLWQYNWETPLDCEVVVGKNMKDMNLITPTCF